MRLTLLSEVGLARLTRLVFFVLGTTACAPLSDASTSGTDANALAEALGVLPCVTSTDCVSGDRCVRTSSGAQYCEQAPPYCPGYAPEPGLQPTPDPPSTQITTEQRQAYLNAAVRTSPERIEEARNMIDAGMMPEGDFSGIELTLARAQHDIAQLREMLAGDAADEAMGLQTMFATLVTMEDAKHQLREFASDMHAKLTSYRLTMTQDSSGLPSCQIRVKQYFESPSASEPPGECFAHYASMLDLFDEYRAFMPQFDNTAQSLRATQIIVHQFIDQRFTTPTNNAGAPLSDNAAPWLSDLPCAQYSRIREYAFAVENLSRAAFAFAELSADPAPLMQLPVDDLRTPDIMDATSTVRGNQTMLDVLRMASVLEADTHTVAAAKLLFLAALDHSETQLNDAYQRAWSLDDVGHLAQLVGWNQAFLHNYPELVEIQQGILLQEQETSERRQALQIVSGLVCGGALGSTFMGNVAGPVIALAACGTELAVTLDDLASNALPMFRLAEFVRALGVQSATVADEIVRSAKLRLGLVVGGLALSVLSTGFAVFKVINAVPNVINVPHLALSHPERYKGLFTPIESVDTAYQRLMSQLNLGPSAEQVTKGTRELINAHLTQIRKLRPYIYSTNQAVKRIEGVPESWRNFVAGFRSYESRVNLLAREWPGRLSTYNGQVMKEVLLGQNTVLGSHHPYFGMLSQLGSNRTRTLETFWQAYGDLQRSAMNNTALYQALITFPTQAMSTGFVLKHLATGGLTVGIGTAVWRYAEKWLSAALSRYQVSETMGELKLAPARTMELWDTGNL